MVWSSNFVSQRYWLLEILSGVVQFSEVNIFDIRISPRCGRKGCTKFSAPCSSGVRNSYVQKTDEGAGEDSKTRTDEIRWSGDWRVLWFALLCVKKLATKFVGRNTFRIPKRNEWDSSIFSPSGNFREGQICFPFLQQTGENSAVNKTGTR